MLVFRSVLKANKLSFLKVNTRQNGFISQYLSNASNSRTCLHTRSKSGLQHPNSFGSSFSNHRHLTKDATASQFVPKHKADNISKNYELIYSNGIVRYYQTVQFFLYPLNMFGIISSAYLVWTNFEDFFQTAVDMGDHPFVAGCTFLAVCSAMMAVFVSICRRALLRIYINPQTGDYVAIRYPWNFLKEQIAFTKSEVEVGGSSDILPFNRSNIKIKGQSFLIVSRDFINPGQYNILIGRGNQKSGEEEEEKGK